MVKHLIGEDYDGVLGSDFYAGYNIHQGWHQRCWVHFLRDAHELKEKYPHDEELFTWAASVKAIYNAAVAWAEHGPDPHLSPRKQQQARVAHQHAYAQQLWQLCQHSVGTATPQHTFCERVERFLPELFVFVAVPGAQPTTIWRSAVFALSSLPARSVGVPAVLKAPRPVWDSPVSLAPGWHSTSILSTNAWLPSP